LPAVALPHPGTSYNPLAESHQSLLRSAHEIELVREGEAEKWREEKEKLEALKRKRVDATDEEGTFAGMVVDVPEDDGVEEQEEIVETVPVRRTPVRKTKGQRTKAARLLAEVRL
jgi:nucleolar protein 53